MKKKLLFCSYNLDIGGIETSLVNMLNSFDYKKYDVTLLLEKKEGVFLNNIPEEVKVLDYNTFNDKNVILRKIKNRLKLIYFILKFKNKFDFAGLYATYLGPEAIITRYASKNNAIWVHSNYYYVYKKNIDKMKAFFDKRKVEKFKKIIFVSNEAMEDFLKVYKSLENKCYVLSNIIDYKKILKLSEEKVTGKFKKPLVVFVGRLDEESKRISLLINSLKEIKYDYECLIIGDGPDKEKYEKLIQKENLDKKVKLLGKKTNPYPYIKRADLVVLTSLYEGFPVVLVEAMILQKLFISTISVSDKYINLKKYGYIIKEEEIQKSLKYFFEGKYINKETFNFEEYDKKIKKDLEKLIEGE